MSSRDSILMAICTVLAIVATVRSASGSISDPVEPTARALVAVLPQSTHLLLQHVLRIHAWAALLSLSRALGTGAPFELTFLGVGLERPSHSSTHFQAWINVFRADPYLNKFVITTVFFGKDHHFLSFFSFQYLHMSILSASSTQRNGRPFVSSAIQRFFCRFRRI